jgi:hypothetical protein
MVKNAHKFGCVLGLLLCSHACAQGETPLQDLARAYANLDPVKRAATEQRIAQARFADCSSIAAKTLEGLEGSGAVQWIYNGMYNWRLIQIDDNQTCVFLTMPEHRGLTREEALMLLAASSSEWPVAVAQEAEAKAKIYAEQVEARESFGAPDSEETGTINGYTYRIHYRGIGPQLIPLDREQRDFALHQKDALRRLPHNSAASAPDISAISVRSQSSLDTLPKPWLDLDFRNGGKTDELVVLDAAGHLRSSDGGEEGLHRNWMLHIPSGRFVSFNDLFTDAQAARSRVSESAKNAPRQHFAEIAFLGPNAEQEARAYREAYTRAWALATTPTPEHFRNVVFDTISLRESPPRLYLHLVFEYHETIPNSGDLPMTSFPADRLCDRLKPEFQHVFDVPPPIE